MSQENIALVREHVDNTNRRDFEKVMEGYDANVELLVSQDVSLDPGTYRGTEAVGEWFGSWFRTFAPGYRLDVAELIAGDDVVVVALDHHAVGRLSGVEVTTRYHNAYWIRENKIARVGLFRERSDALKAAGLTE
jgi:ketosteroid isomerase-like protein